MILKPQQMPIISKMKIYYYYMLIFIAVGCSELSKQKKVESNTLIEKLQIIALEENKIDKGYEFKIANSQETLEYSITYLGDLNNLGYKLIYTGILSGKKDSPHFNAYISIYSQSLKNIGSYYIGSNDKPELSNDSLVIRGVGYCNQVTKISLKDSIPKQIFINCTEKGGDIYIFTNEH